MAIEKIGKSPIFGYGTLEGGALFNVGTYTWYAHEQYLDLWLQGGILALISFICMIVFTHKKARNTMDRANYINFVAVLMAFLTMGIVEHFILRNYYQFWIFICIAFAETTRKGRNLTRERKINC